MEDISYKIFIFLIMIFSANFHEFCHGLSALKLGDDTAKRAGRLTLNPLAHIDFVGTIILPLILLFSNAGFIIGWAKPVPYNPNNLRDKRFGSLKVALAGPMANLGIALIFGLVLRFGFLSLLPITPIFIQMLASIIYLNCVFVIFNLIPVPPLDGSKVIMDIFPKTRVFLEKLEVFGPILAMILAYAFIAPLSQALFTLIVG